MKVVLRVVCAFLAISLIASAATVLPAFQTSAGVVTITPLYHATVLIEAGGKVIYVDPAQPAKLDGLTKADLILLIHTRPDHVDPGSIAEIAKAGTKIMSPAALLQTVKTALPISNGETKTWQGWIIEAVPAYNLKRGPAPGKLFHEKGFGNGYVLSYGGVRFY